MFLSTKKHLTFSLYEGAPTIVSFDNADSVADPGLEGMAMYRNLLGYNHSAEGSRATLSPQWGQVNL